MTIKMKKGDKYADIADNTESIRLAQLEGWSIVKTDQSEQADSVSEDTSSDTESEEKTEVKKTSSTSTKRTGKKR